MAAFSLDAELRDAIYDVVPVEITSVPHLPRESSEWGKVFMKERPTDQAQGCKIFAAKGLKEKGAELYLETLKKVFA